MPKLGRRNESTELDYQWNQEGVTKNAPFGTQATPTVRTKIIGGKPVLVYEDRKYESPRPEGSFAEPWNVSPRRSQTGQGHGMDTPQKLAPLTEKPSEFNPAAFSHKPPASYISAQPDAHNSHRHTPDQKGAFSPHKVIPPITPGERRMPPPAPHGEPMVPPSGAPHPGGVDLTRHLPSQGYLPQKPISLNKYEELELRRRIHDNLTGFDSKKLKDIYLELTGYDRHLTGYVNYSDLGLTLMKFQVNLSADNLRLVAAMFVDEKAEPGVIHYEKVLSFLASSLKPIDKGELQMLEQRYRAELEGVRQAEQALPMDHMRNGVFYNPITHQDDDFSANSKKFPFSDRDNAKLLRLIEQQLLASEEEVDFEHMWQAFRAADRQHRTKMSKDQIKALAYDCRLPLQESLLNQVIDKSDVSNGQYDWQQVLEFIERVQPVKTGLMIPDSKKPAEFAKHYPTPTSNWPMNSDDMAPPSSVPAPANPKLKQNPRRPYDYLETDNPNEYLPPGHPRRDKMQDLEKRREQKDSRDELDRELSDIRKSYEAARQRVEEEDRNKQSENSKGWFDRFMRLAQGLYDLDEANAGQLPADQVAWAVDRYNDAYQLGLQQQDITKIIQQHTQAGKCTIDPFLKSLGLKGS